MMRGIVHTVLLTLCAVSGSQAFVMAPPATRGGAGVKLSTVSSAWEGSFIAPLSCASSPMISNVAPSRPRSTRGVLHMGKVSKFGIFSPAVVAAKIALGESRLNKIRGKTIALHSQVITEYCKWVGASGKLRGLLIRKAKKNGDDLGFLW